MNVDDSDDDDYSDDSVVDGLLGPDAGIDSYASIELTGEDFDTVNHERFRSTKDHKDLLDIYDAYSSTRKAAKALKIERLYRYIMAHGGFIFMAIWRLYLMDIISMRLQIPIHRKLWSCESTWSDDLIIEKCKLQPQEIEGVQLKKELQKAKQNIRRIFKRELKAVMIKYHHRDTSASGTIMINTTAIPAAVEEPVLESSKSPLNSSDTVTTESARTAAAKVTQMDAHNRAREASIFSHRAAFDRPKLISLLPVHMEAEGVGDENILI
jgi:hypothetical protein